MMMWKLLLISVSSVGCISAEKIIIIGAGAAGIATASRLLENNITDFRILEAENRIGGRILSFYLRNAFVDIGAEFVHGEKDNVVFNLAKDYVKHYRDLKKSWIYYAEARKTNPTLLGEYFSLVEDIENAASNTSLGEAYSTRYNTTITEKYKNNSEMLTYSKDFLRTIECLVIASEGAFRWFKTAALPTYRKCEGDQAISWDGLGYKTILEIMLKNFPNQTGYDIDEKISFGKTVSKIISTENTVEIRCQDGSEYISDHVVFTPSLGVLKHDHKNLFQPQLDKAKSDAIDNLGFDGVIKIVIEFSTSWWGDRDDFVFVWNEEAKNNLINDIPFGPVKDGDHWLSWFFIIGKTPKNPNVLTGWLVGPMVPDVEKLTHDEMKNGTLYALRKFIGSEFNITEPVRVIHSKWYNNPNFRGSYSYDTIRSIKNNSSPGRVALSQPIKGKDGVPLVLFAGEATNPRRSSTVDGAIETGYREADRLIRILKR